MSRTRVATLAIVLRDRSRAARELPGGPLVRCLSSGFGFVPLHVTNADDASREAAKSIAIDIVAQVQNSGSPAPATDIGAGRLSTFG